MRDESIRRQLAEGFAQGWREAGESNGTFAFAGYLAVGLGSAIGAILALQ